LSISQTLTWTNPRGQQLKEILISDGFIKRNTITKNGQTRWKIGVNDSLSMYRSIIKPRKLTWL